MKVILTQDVKSLGKKNAVVNVSDGYARNFLFPKNLAKEATTGHLKEVDNLLKKEEAKKQEELNVAQGIASQLKGKTVVFKTKVGDNGKLFGSVTTKEIVEVIEKQYSIPLDKRKVELKENIKILGVYSITVKLHPKVSVEVNVQVTAE
jgi:large subunit ribosomal protein L9